MAAKKWKDICGIHEVPVGRRDVKVGGPCPYCRAVIREVKESPAPESKFKIGVNHQKTG